VDWPIRSAAITKPMIRSGLPNIDSGNPNRHFGKSNNRYGTPALLFDFNRNACSSSSENPVRLQPKSLFGFAEIRSRGDNSGEVSSSSSLTTGREI
jgi:hypothetical protein